MIIDSMLMGDRCGAHTFPYSEVKNPIARESTKQTPATSAVILSGGMFVPVVEGPPHPPLTSQFTAIFYCNQRGIPTEDAVNMIVSGFCTACPERSRRVFRELPMEFAVEPQKLLGVSLEGSVG